MIERLETIDCVPSLWSADVLHSVTCARPALQRLPASPLLRGSLQVQPNRAEARPQPPHRRFAIGPAPQSQPIIMAVESSTPGNWLNP